MPSINIKCDASNASGSTVTIPLDTHVPRQNIHSIRFVNGWVVNHDRHIEASMLSIGPFRIAFDPEDTYMGRNLLQKPQIPYLPLYKDTHFSKNIIVQFKEDKPIDYFPVLELRYSSKKIDDDFETTIMEKAPVVPFWHDVVFWYPRDMSALRLLVQHPQYDIDIPTEFHDLITYHRIPCQDIQTHNADEDDIPIPCRVRNSLKFISGIFTFGLSFS